MSREWVPGDVLLGYDFDIWFVVEVTANSRAAWGEGVHAIDADGNGIDVRNLSDVHRAVVIDPDSPADQRRLLSLLRSSGAFRGVVSQDIALDCIGDALRAFHKPPRPEEPQGLGAVVESEDGKRWIRTDVEQPAWSQRGNAIGRWTWSKVNAVRVLSEGVTP